MIRGLYMAGGALVQQADSLEVVTNNVANINTIGYKADRTAQHAFQDVLIARTNEIPGSRNIGYLTRGEEQLKGDYVDFSPGATEKTGNPLDVAIRGPGFLTLQDGEGNRFYTRAGNLELNGNRELVTIAGDAVLDDRGATITVPDGGSIAIDQSGQVSVGNQPVARLGLVNFSDPGEVEKVGGSKFRDKGAAGVVPVAGNTLVLQGFLEHSNVSALSAIGELTMILRSFEASQKIVTMMDETLRQAAADLGRTQ